MAADKISQTVNEAAELFDIARRRKRSTASRRARMVAPSLLNEAERVNTASSENVCRVSRRQARAGEDSAHARGADRTADLRNTPAVIPTATTPTTWRRIPSLQAEARGGIPRGRRALGVATNDFAASMNGRGEYPAENALYRMARELAACVIERQSTPPAAAGVAESPSIWTRPTTGFAWRATTDVLQ